MTELKLIGEGRFFDLQVYRGDGIEQEAAPFIGVLRQHYNPNIVLLLSNPLQKMSIAYEIRVDDILHVEELASETGPEGVTVERVKLWVKKGSTVIKMEPILVSDTASSNLIE